MVEAQRKATHRVALTGGIASGKSLVESYLQAKGFPVIDADAVVHQLLKQDEELKAQIRTEFGDTVFHENGSVNRPALGAIVFNDIYKRKLLESWIHPKTRKAMEDFLEQHADSRLVVFSIPLLFESSLEKHYDEVWLLETDEETQIQRLMQSRGMSQNDAEARIRNQMPLPEKKQRLQELPHYQILDNHHTPEMLYQQLDSLLGVSGVEPLVEVRNMHSGSGGER